MIHNCFQAVTLFNAGQHEEAIMRVQELAKACPGTDIHACWIVEVSIMLNQFQVPALALIFFELRKPGISTSSARNLCLE
jgi:hypothetical protein